MLKLHIYGRHTTRAGTITNEAQGDDTWELLGPAPELRAYAEHGIETQAMRPHGADRTYLERVYRNILRELDGADLSYYAAPVFRTKYHGAPYGEGGEAGPDTDNPRQLAEATLHAPGQWLEATAPDGSRKQFKYCGPSHLRVEEIDLPDNYAPGHTDPDGGNIMDQDFCLAHETARLDAEIVRNRTRPRL
jgi:hypothetical protein